MLICWIVPVSYNELNGREISIAHSLTRDWWPHFHPEYLEPVEAGERGVESKSRWSPTGSIGEVFCNEKRTLPVCNTSNIIRQD